MRETLHCSNGLDETRIRRAFRWVVTFRDFPVGSYQTVDGDSMMSEALTFFTKGRAEFYLDDVRRGDRLPGILSTDHDEVGRGGTFTLKYVEPTTRVCIPRMANNGELPVVKQHSLSPKEAMMLSGKFLVCLGSVTIGNKIIAEEKTFSLSDTKIVVANTDCLLLEILT